MKHRIISACMLLGLMATMGSASAQKLYKYVDKDGNVTFSDQVPPEQVDEGREEMNAQGVKINEVERARTDEELRIDSEKQAALDLVRQEQEDRLTTEKKLLDSYASADHIIQVRDEKIEPIKKSIISSKDYLSSKSISLSKLMDRVATQERNSEAISGNTTLAISRTREEIMELKAFIERKQSEYIQIKNKYEQEHSEYVRIMTQRSTPALSEG